MEMSDEMHKKVNEGNTGGASSPGYVGPRNQDAPGLKNLLRLMDPLVYISDAAIKSPAKALLHEFCAKKHWKQPVFECCKDQGPDHRRMFTVKVLVETDDTSMRIIECCGNPQRSKKAAADNAAEGAIWCLRKMGYQLKN